MDGYLELAEASARLGLSQEAIRKRLHRGTLAGHKIDGRWVVACPDACQDAAGRPDGRLDDGIRTETGRQDARPDATAAEFLAVIERQQQTIMEMSGRLGYFQRRIHELEETVLALQAPTSYHPAEVENGPHSSVHAAANARSGPESSDPSGESTERPLGRPKSRVPGETPNGSAESVSAAARSRWWRFWRGLGIG